MIFYRFWIFILLLLALASCKKGESFGLDFASEILPTATISVDDSSRLTTNRNITLRLSSDRATEMAFFINQNCSSKDASWQSYQSTPSLQLPDRDGVYRISVLLRDTDHFSSACEQVEVTLDRTGPDAPNTITLQKTVTGLSESPVFSFAEALDPGAGVDYYEFRLLTADLTQVLRDWTSAGLSRQDQKIMGLSLTDGSEYVLQVRARDKLGNIGSSRTSGIFSAGPFVSPQSLSLDVPGVHRLKFQLSRAVTREIRVQFQIEDVTSLADLDYDSLSLTEMTIPSGATEGSVLINIRNNNQPGTRRRFQVKANSADTAIVGTSIAQVDLPDPGLATPTTGYVHVEVGNVGCGLKTGGDIYCWGFSQLGELGLGSGTLSSSLARKLTLPAPATKLVRGIGNFCALLNNGQAACWGQNTYGQLGTGTTQNQFSPVIFAPGASISDITDIRPGYQHTCWTTQSSGLWCVGRGNSGQLGSTPGNSLTQVAVDLLNGAPGVRTEISDFAVGTETSCAVIVDGSVRCWGKNQSYAAGQNSGSTIVSPQLVSGVTNAVKITSNGASFCALLSTGAAKCWGDNSNGQLGIAPPLTSSLPVDLPLSDLSEINGSCAKTNSGDFYCWGSNQEFKPPLFGLASWPGGTRPLMQKMMVTGITQLSISSHACGLSAGQIKCWGTDTSLRGDGIKVGDTTAHFALDPALPATNIRSISTNGEMACFIMENDDVYCGGNGPFGNLPLAKMSLPTSEKVLQVASGTGFVCALGQSGDVYCLGTNASGALGQSDLNLVSTDLLKVPSVSGVTQISAFLDSVCARTSAGRVWCWGDNPYGNLGQGTIGDTAPPGQLSLNGVSEVHVGEYSSCALLSNAQVWCWGALVFGGSGQTTGFSNVPQQVQVSSIAKLSVGSYNSCGLTSSGVAKCWGFAGSGGLGNGSLSDEFYPVNVQTGGVMISDISVGNAGACAVATTGDVYCWGDQLDTYFGQLGHNTTAVKSTPYLVPHLAGAKKVFMGNFSCGIFEIPGRPTNFAKCWGYGAPPYTVAQPHVPAVVQEAL